METGLKKMSLKIRELARKIKLWTPTYGVCGGQALDCAVRRPKLDPLDQLFYDHDNELAAAEEIESWEMKSAARDRADKKLHDGLAALTEEDFKKIPTWIWKPPFLKRFYAKKFRKACLEIF